MGELRTQLTAALIVLTGSVCLPDAPPSLERVGFGRVVCLIEPSAPGPSFRMTIDDRADRMIVRTSQSDMTLPRDEELTDSEIHVGVLTDGVRTIAVTLDRNLETTVTTINDRVSIGAGRCSPL